MCANTEDRGGRQAKWAAEMSEGNNVKNISGDR